MNTIDDFILDLTGQQKAIIAFLHEHLTHHHDLVGKIRFKIPMYYRRSWVCYLNPIKKDGVELAYIHGHLLSNEQGLLQRKDRKMVAGIDLYDVSALPMTAIDQITQEAIILEDLKK